MHRGFILQPTYRVRDGRAVVQLFGRLEDGDLLLGTWQALMLVELDGPRRDRRVSVTILPDLD